MESYPGELLVGVFPLVFCVDATLSKVPDNSESNGAETMSHPRGQFDRFLDAMAGSLLDEPQVDPLQVDEGLLSPTRRRPDDRGAESDQEDEMILGADHNTTSNPGPRVGADGSSVFDSEGLRSPSFSNMGFPRFSREGGDKSNYFGSSSSRQGSSVNTSFAKTLQEGQGFFQRARIVSVSARHGFPPSKDATGQSNRTLDFLQGKKLQSSKLLTATQKRPIDGIVPSGWLEKHAAALPSCIILVAHVSTDSNQSEHDAVLLQTLESLQLSLASKRECTIQIVGLMQENINVSQAAQWNKSIAEKMEGQPPLTLLPVSDVQQDASPSTTLQYLFTAVRQASLRYYVTQTRRTKSKLSKLGPARKTPLLLPLSIRYCFKVAIFYEFQWKPEKSLRYLVEAHRYVETYYRYLLQQREIDTNNKGADDLPAEQGASQMINVANPGATEDISGAEGVEVSLPNEDDDLNNLLLKPPSPPEDMVHQCRAIADWLNFKILQLGFTSHTEGGLLAASAQWQKHSQAFCSPRRSFVCSPDHSYVDWSYVAHQRMVMSQLLERHPPKALGNLGSDFDEVLLRCSPWKSYQAAAEALLRLGAELKRAANVNTFVPDNLDVMRSRYVGGLDKDGFQPKFQEQMKLDHRELALDCMTRAISLYERDLEKLEKDDAKETVPWSRSGARMYYLAGGTLLGLERFEEATSYLEKAVRLARGWNGLELSIRRLLIKCYEKPLATNSADRTESLASMLLDSYFNAKMSSSDLRQALEKFSTLSGGGKIKWYRDCFDEADSRLPFSFALTFPSSTHATAGDSVQASILIRSNLDYAVHVNSVTLLTLAGHIAVPSSDLLSAKNAHEGTAGGIIIQANADIWVSTQIKLPKDLNQIAVDETGNGGEKEGVAGKGSFAKKANPRTAGLTAAAGARLVSEDWIGKVNAEKRSGGQWSLRCLGGKPLRCDGLRLTFHPVYTTALGDQKNTEIELTIEKKQAKTVTKIQRTPFEEENYLSSSWFRPRHIPMNRGPRCLRVLPPMADLKITNVTESYTNGKVLEGTVNRIVLRLDAGLLETCTNVKFQVKCSSVFVSADGKTTRISSEPNHEEGDREAAVDPNNPRVRTPVLVRPESDKKASATAYGYDVPSGWALIGDGQGSEEHTEIVTTLQSGNSAYAVVDVYRPSPPAAGIYGAPQPTNGDEEEELAHEHSMCQTDVDISIHYRQSRPTKKTKHLSTKRRGRKKPGEQASSLPESGDSESDFVSVNKAVSLVWNTPVSALFSPGLKQTQPSGNRHPSNSVHDGNMTKSSAGDSQQIEMVLIDGERVSTKCTLEATAAADGLVVDIDEVRFEDSTDAPCTFKLVSGKDENGLLYKSRPEDPCSKLILGSRFSLAWIADVLMKSNYLKGSVSASLGVLSITWSPCELDLPDEVVGSGSDLSVHGPLRLSEPCICHFKGPPCYIENSPFESTMDRLPDSLSVATPFDVTYHIKNKTSLDQKLKVVLNESEGTSPDSQGFLVSGLVNGEISLGPFESHTLSYTALPTRAGRIWMPQVCVSSDRYKTFLIQEMHGPRRSLLVTP